MPDLTPESVNLATPSARRPVDLTRLVRNIHDQGFHELEKTGLRGQRDEGLICPLVSRDLNDSNDLCVSWSRMLPGQHHLRHHHPDASEFYVFLKGTPTVWLGDTSFRARPGDGVYIPTGVLHGLTNDTDEEIELIVGLSMPADWQFVFDE